MLTYKLTNGVEIPVIGYGTWQVEGEVAVASVEEAIKAGYRHIDTAQAYGNEKFVGEGIRRSGIARDELFVTTKLTNANHSYDLTMSSFVQSLKDLGLDYVDLFLVHWPCPIQVRDRWQDANAETWRAIEELYADGRIRAIGVSNFHQRHIDALLQTAKVAPMVDQIRLCPGCTQDEVVDYCRKNNILLEAYSPLGRGQVSEVEKINKIASKYGKSASQIAIRWSLDMGFLPLPKSVTPSRIRDNLNVFDFELTKDEVETLKNLTGCAGLAPDPDTMPF